PRPEATAVYVEPAALRGLLVRLGVKVECSFRATGTKKKLTPGRGRGPSWVLKRAVLTLAKANGEDEAQGSVHQVDADVGDPIILPEDRHQGHTGLDQSPRLQHGLAVDVHAVALAHRLRLPRQVERVGRAARGQQGEGTLVMSL